MPSKERVEAKLQEMIDRLDQADDDVHANLARALPRPRKIQIDVTDLGVSYWTEMSEGRMGELHEGEAPDGHDIRLKASSADLAAMIDGERKMLSLYLRGQIQIDAGFSDLLALRKLA